MRSTQHSLTVKHNAVRQVVELGHDVKAVALALKVTAQTVNRWVHHYGSLVDRDTAEKANRDVAMAHALALDRALFPADVKNSRDELYALDAIHRKVCAERDALRAENATMKRAIDLFARRVGIKAAKRVVA